MNTELLNIYEESEITRKMKLSINEIGEDFMTILQNKINNTYTGKCSIEGYIKKNSCKIIQTSTPILDSNGYCDIHIVFKCLICNPPINSIISCKIMNITRAGINAKSSIEDPSPINVFVSREYKSNGNDFSNLNINEIINIKVIGKTYQLNDDFIYLIAELV